MSEPLEDEGTVFQSEEDQLLAKVESLPEEPPELEGYELESRLGEGSFGEVWKGRQTRTGQTVAVKILRNSGLDWKLLERETERLREVAEHPYVVTLLDADLKGQPAYIVMPFLKNGSLAEVKNPELHQVEEWISQVTQALAYTHDKGILHCDIKPSNILLDDEGRARLVDFGQAVKSDDGEANYGTLGYMPPEQVEPDATPSALWDMYALGATAYRLLSSRHPRVTSENISTWQQSGFSRETAQHYAEHLRTTPLEWLHHVNPVVDEDLAFAVMRCLVPTPSKRMQSASALLGELEKRRSNLPLESARPWKLSYRSKRWVRRNKLILTLFFIITLITGPPLVWYVTDPLLGISVPGYVAPANPWPTPEVETPELHESSLASKSFAALVDGPVDLLAFRLLRGDPMDERRMEAFVSLNQDELKTIKVAASRPSNLLEAKGFSDGWHHTAACEVAAQVMESQGRHDLALRYSLDRLILGHRFTLHNFDSLTYVYPGHILAPLQFLEDRDLSLCSTPALSRALSDLRALSEKWPLAEHGLSFRDTALQKGLSIEEFESLEELRKQELLMVRAGEFHDLNQMQGILVQVFLSEKFESRLPAIPQMIVRYVFHPDKFEALKEYQRFNFSCGAEFLRTMSHSGVRLDRLRHLIATELERRGTHVSGLELGKPIIDQELMVFYSRPVIYYLIGAAKDDTLGAFDTEPDEDEDLDES
jgi:serine/threonine protein kinase